VVESHEGELRPALQALMHALNMNAYVHEENTIISIHLPYTTQPLNHHSDSWRKLWESHCPSSSRTGLKGWLCWRLQLGRRGQQWDPKVGVGANGPDISLCVGQMAGARKHKHPCTHSENEEGGTHGLPASLRVTGLALL